ncbi:alkylation response protein AidB-like acyl-CoA dehydrogenase [Paraburkholderia atlantica]|uniref:Alkylation response protein AidB-like acyl-CoA dehydrogenase n=1 Tax=Paraburkholderia atlantica TaxID=2654982 RepID=A0A6I1Q139_PARAM|nr:hypothetical protein [Paraburkholderia atlantica]MBB5415269.1 alkylation response protein AidB-like acyl-CoA dehydrogenase [Paraburkholderia atlantica]MBB5424072.1 alkylation response protein AidB-like acyl-CoA dehydrogenase [Paraburkholderia atlantica]MPW08214.1 monooxygenase [Paraburkholderia atlantica]
MTVLHAGWGGISNPKFDAVLARFRPIFADIASGAVTREVAHELPFEQIAWLKAEKFGALRVPEDEGGYGLDLPELFSLLTELSEADSNITQALRGHFAFAEDVLNKPAGKYRTRWIERLVRGELAGNAWTEIGNAQIEGFSTRISERDGKLWLNGEKYYTTGSLFADWLDVGAADQQARGVCVSVRRESPGLNIVDDWDGIGQTLTASGTSTFTDVEVFPEDIVFDEERFQYATGLYQTVHLATLAGIGRALAGDVARAVAARRRTYDHASASRSSADPQVLQIVGKVRSAAYAASAITIASARALQRAFDARFANEEERVQINAETEIETAQAQVIITDLILDASTRAFDSLGASATKKPAALDRHWRNARTLSSHNPRIYKERIVGDYAVNGTLPPPQWRIGVPAATS